MSSLSISAMPTAAALGGTELVPVVQTGANKKSTVNAIQDFICHTLVNGELVRFDGTELVHTGNVTYFGGGGIHMVQLIVDQDINAAGGTFTVNATGDVVCNTVAPANGFTGSGVFTTFTIVNGIITAAS